MRRSGAAAPEAGGPEVEVIEEGVLSARLRRPFDVVRMLVGLLLSALVLAFFSNLFSSLTHYANGPAPVVFGTGYVTMGTWWGMGAVISVINIVIWVGAGAIWWKVIGLL